MKSDISCEMSKFPGFYWFPLVAQVEQPLYSKLFCQVLMFSGTLWIQRHEKGPVSMVTLNIVTLSSPTRSP
jgi:hypothetical protein